MGLAGIRGAKGTHRNAYKDEIPGAEMACLK